MNNTHKQLRCCSEIESVRKVLLQNGWQYLCEGDWAWIYLAPDSLSIARLCTFDPAYRLYLNCCLEHPSEIHLPNIELLHDMPHGSYVAIMERFHPCANAEEATETCELLASDDSPDLPEHLTQLQAILSALRNNAAKNLFQFGKFDLRPDHIMTDKLGEFVVLDPIFVDGRKLIKAMQKDLASVLQHYSVDELLNFLKIAAMAKNPDDPVVITLRNDLPHFRA